MISKLGKVGDEVELTVEYPSCCSGEEVVSGIINAVDKTGITVAGMYFDWYYVSRVNLLKEAVCKDDTTVEFLKSRGYNIAHINAFMHTAEKVKAKTGNILKCTLDVEGLKAGFNAQVGKVDEKGFFIKAERYISYKELYS